MKITFGSQLLSMTDAEALVSLNNMRKLNNLEPLTELPKNKTDNGGGAPAPTGKTAEEIEAERLKAEEEKNKSGNSGNEPGELDDEALRVLLEKRGIKVASLDELKPKDPLEDPELTAEKLDAAKLTYGLEKGLFNKKTYDNYISDSKAPHGLVFAVYLADAKKTDPSLTDEEITAEFREDYGLDAEPTSRKFQRGQKDLNILSDKIMNEKYGKILSLDSEFKANQESRKVQSDRKKTILAKTPQYKKDIQAAFSDLKKITTKFSDTKSYEAVVLDEHINEIMNDFLLPETAERMIDEGYTPEKLKGVAFNVLLSKKFPVIANELIKQALLDNQKGAHGIPESSGVGGNGGSEPELTEGQKAYKALNEKEKAKQKAAAN